MRTFATRSYRAKVVFFAETATISCRNMQHVTLHDKTFELAIRHEEIVRAIEEVARRISTDYSGRTPLLLGVLNGSFMFMAELVQHLNIACELSFVKLASYDGTRSTGTVHELIGLTHEVSGRDLLIVEDIVETGRSIAHMHALLEPHHPRSIEVATLLFKPALYRATYPIRYAAIETENDFLVGYGLDYNQLGRNLGDLYKLTHDDIR